MQIGEVIRKYRKEKNMTQDEMASRLGVSAPAVNKWENGNNMPDIDILIDISDFYEVDLRELLNGEGRSEIMNKDMKETVLQAVDYTNTEAERTNKRTKKVLLLGVLCWAISSAINHTSLSGYSFVCNISAFAEGAGIAFILLSIVLLSRYGIKISEFKKRLLKKDL